MVSQIVIEVGKAAAGIGTGFAMGWVARGWRRTAIMNKAQAILENQGSDACVAYLESKFKNKAECDAAIDFVREAVMAARKARKAAAETEPTPKTETTEPPEPAVRGV